MGSTMDWQQLLDSINTRHQTTFTFVGRYQSGEQGAYVIRDKDGEQSVLKWIAGTEDTSRLERVKAVTDSLRNISYPASHYLYMGTLSGGIYSIQCAFSGAPLPSRHTQHYLPRLLELNQLQAAQALSGLGDWHQEAVDTVLYGGDGYCLHWSLQEYAPATATLLKTLQELVSTYQHTAHRTDDIVHGDFQHANILAGDHDITGIVDWDGVRAGDRVFDIATLLFYSYDDYAVRENLWRYALERARPQLMSVYLCHLILRQIDWSLRYHDQQTANMYLDRSTTMLADIYKQLKSAR